MSRLFFNPEKLLADHVMSRVMDGREFEKRSNELEEEKKKSSEEEERRRQAEDKLKEKVDNDLENKKTELERVKQDLDEKKRQRQEEEQRYHDLLSTHQEMIDQKEQERQGLMESRNKLLMEKEQLETQLQNEENELARNLEGEREKLKNILESQGLKLKSTKALATVYDEFRQWVEDQALNSYGKLNFKEFNTSDIGDAIIKSTCIGSGGYGKVYRANIHGESVAIKILAEMTEEGKRQFKQEVEILRKIRHPNLVTLVGACSEKFALIYEFLPNGSLEDRLSDKFRATFSWQERVKAAASICSALLLLHNTKPNPIAHGDLKPDNILYDEKNVCKLNDFGISRVLYYTSDTVTPHHTTAEPKGSGSYKDPDFENTRRLTPQSDVFALGIILLQLVTGKGPQGLRSLVHTQLRGRDLEAMDADRKKNLFRKFKILDETLKLSDEEIEDAMKMMYLGLRCSIDTRKQRPDMGAEVWPEIQSIMTNTLRQMELSDGHGSDKK